MLGLAWNIESFISNGLRDFGVPPLPRLAQALAFASLGLLPAVVVHSVLRSGLSRLTSPAALAQVLIAYALGGCAALIQIGSAVQGRTVPATSGLRLLTIGFSGLIVPLAIVTRRQPGARRALWMTALAVFAVSALHLSQQEQLQLSWPVELIGHHASLPLVLSILYQEYPFALADVFLKRALTLVALMATALIAYVTMESSGLLSTRESGNVPALLFLGVSLATALLVPALMRASSWFVDSVVLRRVDYDLLRSRIARRLADATMESAALDVVTQAIGPALSAGSVRWHETPHTDTEGLAILDVPSRGISADVTVPTTDRPRFVILVRDLRGGRRLLSDDIAMLESIAQLLGRRVDAIRIERERQEQSIREQEIRRLASEAELRALRAQINPHFLFNALTTDRVSHRRGTRSRARNAPATHTTAAPGSSVGGTDVDAWRRALAHHGLSRHRTSAIRRAALGRNRCACCSALRRHSTAPDRAACGECDQTRDRAVPAPRPSRTASPSGSVHRSIKRAHHHGAGHWPRTAGDRE